MAERLRGLAVYRDRRQLAILLLGFSSGLPLLLVYSTLSARLAQAGIHRAEIGLLLLAQLPYNFKFVWAPLLDRVPPPIPIGQRRGWALSIQIALLAAIFAMGAVDPQTHIGLLAALGVSVAFLSASQDIVIDAFRIELLPPASQGAGAAMVVAGYRVAMLAAGAGALAIADVAGWFWAYGTMGLLLVVGAATFLVMGEPAARVTSRTQRDWRATLEETVVAPFRDFIRRPGWLAILIFIPLYKMGEAMAGAMAKPFYISLGFSLTEIAKMSSLVAFVTTLCGGLLGGLVVARFGILRAVLICGVAQSLGNLAYVALDAAGHQTVILALSAASEDLTGGMAGAAFIAFLSRLTRAPYTATQFALLSSLEALGRSLFTAPGGALSQTMGWTPFFLLTTIITLPSLALLHWISKRWPQGAGET
jgi:PAT family beta-lactamase induction signal transducer AmpG